MNCQPPLLWKHGSCDVKPFCLLHPDVLARVKDVQHSTVLYDQRNNQIPSIQWQREFGFLTVIISDARILQFQLTVILFHHLNTPTCCSDFYWVLFFLSVLHLNYTVTTKS